MTPAQLAAAKDACRRGNAVMFMFCRGEGQLQAVVAVAVGPLIISAPSLNALTALNHLRATTRWLCHYAYALLALEELLQGADVHQHRLKKTRRAAPAHRSHVLLAPPPLRGGRGAAALRQTVWLRG